MTGELQENDDVRLTWGSPLHANSGEIRHYVVETCITGCAQASAWTALGNVGVDDVAVPTLPFGSRAYAYTHAGGASELTRRYRVRAHNGLDWPHAEWTIPARTTGASIISTPASDNTYRRGEHIDVAVDFSRPVTVVGTPQLHLALGDDPANLAGASASYNRGSGTTRLVFRYTVNSNDLDTTGLQLNSPPLLLNGGSIKEIETPRDAVMTLADWHTLTPEQYVDGRNRAPVFATDSVARSISETVGDGTEAAARAIGAPVTATDADTVDTLAYSLEGADAASFGIDASTGQISTKAQQQYDHEAKASYSVTVKADDANGGTDTVAVNIAIADVDEPPLAPDAPSVSPTFATTMGLDVSWAAPANAGRPDIAHYDLQYRAGDSGDWTDGPQDVTGTTAAIAGLTTDTGYQVQVRAVNDEGEGAWSSPGAGRTWPLPQPATGAPDITGAWQVGRILTASKGDIADVNGVPPETEFTWQWLRVDGSSEREISGATGKTYTLTAADVGKRLKVTAAFTDSLNTEESRTSPAYPPYGSVLPATCAAPSLGSRREIWSASITAGAIASDLARGQFEQGYSDGAAGRLSDTDFTIGSTRHAVVLLSTQLKSNDALPIDLRMQLDRSLTAAQKAALTLHICDGAAIALSGSTLTGSLDSFRFGGFGSLWFNGLERDVRLSLPANTPATGAPGIAGTPPVVGQTLTASKGDIADAEGLPPETEFDWQWLRVDGTAETDIAGATGKTYALTVADAAKRVKVKAAFTDGLGGEESRTGAATAPVTSPKPVIAIAPGTTPVTEGTDATFTLSRTGATTAALTVGVDVSETGGDMVASADEGAKTVKFEAGGSSATLSVATVDDQRDEPHGAVTALISADSADPATYLPGVPGSATVIVSDDEPDSTNTLTIRRLGTGGSDVCAGLDQRPNPPVEDVICLGVWFNGTDPAGFTESDVEIKNGTVANFLYAGSNNTVQRISVNVTGPKGELLVFRIPQGALDAGNVEAVYRATITGSANAPPVFAHASYLGSIAETVGDATETAARDVGAAVTATDADGDTLSYSLEREDASFFDIDSSSGQIRTKAGTRYDHEAKSNYWVTVKAEDVKGFTEKANAYLTVTDVAEAPVAPGAPSVSATSGSTTSLDVSWGAPSNTGRPDIEHYDLQYRGGASGDWTDGPQDVTGTSTAVGSLTAGRFYQVRVRAVNAEGDGPWSKPGSATVGNAAPTAADNTVTTAEDVAYTFGAGDFGFADADGHTLSSVKIVTLPASAKGTLSLDGVAVTAAQSVTRANIDGGKLKYTPPKDQSGDNFASFTFKVSDGMAESALSYTMTIDVAGLSISVDNASIAEAAGTATVTIGGPTFTTAQTIALALSGTAAETDDFTIGSKSLTLPAGASSVATTVTAVQDTLSEEHETVIVTASHGDDSIGSATVTITDDDGSPTVTLSLSDASIGEDAGVSTVTASLSHASGVATTVTVSVSPDTPATTSDYSLSANKVLTIAAGRTASTGTVTVTGVDNDVDAADKTVQVKGAASNTVGTTGPADVELTLEDDDTRGVTVSKSELDIAEGDDGVYTVVLTSEPTGTVTVTPSRSSGDTDVTVSGALTFTVGNWSTVQTVTVSAAQDGDAVDDTAQIGHTVSGADYGSETAGSVTVTVDDDETASSGVTLSVSPDSVSEGASATTVTVTARLNGGTRSEATPVAVTVGSGTATSGTDFTAVAGFSISIAANTRSHTGTFSLAPTQDTLDEPNETVSVSGSVTGLTVTGATVRITDDDASPTVTLSLSDASIGEDAGVSTVTASLSHASSVATTVTVSVSPDTPATTSDYSLSANKVLTIAAGGTASTGTVTVTGADNDVDAANKTVQVKGAASNTVGTTGPADVELTLEDDDTRGVTVSKSELDIAEGDDGVYTVVLTSEPTGTVTVTPVRSSGDTDVTVSGALTFTVGNWSTAQTVTVSAAQDGDAVDDTAQIGHTVSGADYGSETAGSVTVTVDDDETASSGVTLSVSPDSVSEGASATTVTVTARLNGGTRSEATPVAVTVGSGTATSGTDFTAVAGFSIGIAANTRSHTGTFSLAPTQDTLDEPNETVSVSGSVTGLTVTGATVRITDDDASPTVTLSLSDASIGEDAGVSTVTASLSHASSVATTVTVSVSPDTPATTSDYSLSANKVLTIAAGGTASTGTVTVTGVDNDVDAADKTVQVKGAASNAVGTTGPADVELTLEDDDTRGVTVSKSELGVDEGDDGAYTVVLTSEPTGTVTVTPSRSSGDTDVTVSGALTFTAADWSTAQTVTVSAAQDGDAVDDDAVVGHTVSGADYGSVIAASVDVTVDDDETPSSGVTLSVSPDSVSEGASATTVTVTARLNGGTRSEATPVAVTVGSGTATSGTDFTAVAGFSIGIAANTRSHTGTFSLAPTQDTLDEPNETVSVSGSVTGLTVTGATVRITDDDASPTVTLSLSDASIGEDAGVSTVTASLSHASSVATTVTVSVSPDTPATTSDYSLSANKVLTIAAGRTASTGTVTVTGADNDVDAADKTVQVKGAASNTVGTTGPADVELTLKDDDTRGVTVSKSELDIAEGDDGAYTVVLTSEPTGTVTVTPARSSGDTDVTVSGTLTFTVGNWSTAQTVTVSAAQDGDAVDDTAQIGHTVSGADYGSAMAASVDVTVDDDETPSSGVTLSVSPESVSEGASATTVTVTARLNGGTRSEATPVAVTVGSGTATSGTDFTSVAGFSISIAANTQSHTGTFSLAPTQDTLDEPNETVSVTGTTTVTDVSVTGATVRITDDDASPTVTLSLSDTSIGEDAGVSTVTASLSHASSVATTVTVSVSPDTPATASDYKLSTDKVLTIAAGGTASTGTVTITGVDNRVDTVDKTVQVMGAASNSLGVASPSAVVLTIEDDDGVPGSRVNLQPSAGISVSVSPESVSEGAAATTVTVRAALDGLPRSGDTEVEITVGSGTATSGTDFAAVSGFTITIGPNTLSETGTFALTPTNDTLDEPNETVLVSGTSTVAGFPVTGSKIEIIDDDASPTVTLSLSDGSIGEDAGVSTVTASLSHASIFATTITVSASPVSPAAASDYKLSTDKVLTIAAGRTASTGTVTVTGADNDVDAADKTVQVKGAATNTLGITGPADVQLTLEDDDTRGVTVSKSELDVDEGDDGAYTVVLTSEPTGTVTVTPARSSGDTDVTVSGALTFTVGNWSTAQTVTVSAAQDGDAVDDTAVIGHTVSGADYGSAMAASVDVTVDDDETPSSGVTLSVSPDSVSESASATTVTVTARLNGGTRSEAAPVAVTVGSGTATSGTDFAAVAGFSISIAANTRSHTGTFDLSPTQDTLDEPGETVSVTGTTTVTDVSVTGTTVRITDDDASPTVTLSLSDASIGEDAGVSTVTASLSHASSVATTVTVSVSPDTPAVTGDYSISANKRLTIAAGQTASTGAVMVTGVNNDVDAADKTVQVKGAASNTVGTTGPADVELTLEDDDTRGVTVSKSELDVGEGDDGAYTVVLTSEPTGTVTVTPARSSGDTDVTVSGALTFTVGNWSTAQTVTVSAAQDGDAVDDDAVIGHTVSGADYGSAMAASVDVTVDDDETVSSGVTLSASPESVSEGASATTVTVTAKLNSGTRSEATPVAVTVGSGTATSGTDFTAVAGFSISIAANTRSYTGTFSLSPTQDTVDEPNETVSVSGSVTGLTVTGTTVRITDDDDSPTVTLSLSDASIGEDAGVSTVTASLSHASGVATTVTVSVSPDTPATTSDYSLSANKVLTIAAGGTASTGTVTVTGVDNDVDAADKTVQVKGAASNAVGTTGPADVELTLEDDDTRGVTVSKSELDIAEGDDGAYTVVLTSEPTGTVTVTPARSSGDTDVTVSGALTFTVGNWSTAQTVTVSAAQDGDAVDDTAEIGHTVSGADYGSAMAASVDVTVDDDETPSSGVTLSVSPDSVSEGASATTVTVTARLNGGTRSEATPVAVTVGSGTATSGTDFTAVAGFSIGIAANTRSHTGTFSLAPTQDTLDEPNETVSVSGSVTGLTVTGATVRITDDDASPTVTLSLSDASIGEDAGVSTVTASLSHASSVATTVTVSVSPDTPATTSDYSLSANKVLTIAAGGTASTGTVTVTGVDNDVDAADKTVQVKGAASNTVGTTGPADVELTLEDDDTRGVTVSKSELDIAEGDDGVYTVVLTSEPTGTVTVTPVRSSGDTDVTVSGTLTFTVGNWSTVQTVTVSAAQDGDAVDDTAQIGHTVSGADYGSETAGSVTVTVDDDETASSGVTLSVSPDSVSEGASATTVTVTARLNGGTRSEATPVAVTVGSGTATSGTDFTAVAGFSISIAANTRSHTGTFSLAPTQDTLDEPNETVSVSGSVTGLTVTGATVRITDDDASPTVTLSLSDASISEDAGVSTVTASLSHASGVATTVTVSVSPDTPAVTGDYSISANKRLTIAAGGTASTGAVTVTGVDNDVDAANKTVQVKGAASNTVGTTGPADVELTLEDDDTRGVTVSKSELDIAEGDDGAYTVVLTSEPTGTVTVTPVRSSGDTDVTVSGTLTFTVGNWSTAQTVTVSAAQDGDAVDDDAVVGHTVSGADYGSVIAASVDVTVDDDETPSSGVTLSVSPDSVSEGASATTVTVTASLNGATRGEATPVVVTVGSGTAESGTDFAAVPGFTIAIPANTRSHTGTFILTPTQDTLDEPDETVSVSGSVTGLTVTGSEVEIADDDDSPTVNLSLSDSSIGEGGGSTTVTASLSHASSVATSLTVSVSPDSSAVTGDYSISTNKRLTIAAGQTASTGAVTITGVNNDVDAADKTVQVKGAASNTVGTTGPADVELTLEDDDTRGVTVSKSELDIAEGDDGAYTVVLTSEPTGTVTVTPARSSGDTDVTVSGTLTFTAGNWSTAQTVTVSAAQDGDAVDDTAEIEHTVSGADYGSETAGSVTVTVDDDETASSGVTLSVSPDSVSEGASATTVTVTASLNGATRGEATPVVVTVGSGTAESGTDFAAVPGFTIAIPANTRSHTGTFTLTPTQDTEPEPDETVSVNGSVTGLTVTGTTVQITDDDDSPTVNLSLSDSSIAEGGASTTVTASLSHASSVATTVTVSVSPDTRAVTGDYSLSANKVLTIAAGETASTGTVTITGVDNDVDAANKTVQVMGAAVNSLGIADPSHVELTLEDDDTRGVTVSKSALEVEEGDDGTYTVVLTSEPTGTVTVTPARSSGDTDVTVSGALTFTAADWSTAQTVTVSAAQDTDAADDTAVVGHTVSGADYSRVTAASVDVSVDDDETASSGVTLSVSPESVSEGASATTVTVTARLNGATRREATAVAVTVGSGTAISGTDFTAVPGFRISIPANTRSNTGTFTLTPTQDTQHEPNETVSVSGSVTGLTVTGSEVEIADDDDSPTVTVSLSDSSIGEDGGSATVTASLSHASRVATTVTVSVSPDAPAVAGDYSMSTNKTLTIAPGTTASRGAVTITGVDNDVDAADKTVQVHGAAVNSLGVTGPSVAELTLEDDDTRGVAVSKSALDIAEGEHGVYTVALTSEPTGQVTVTPARSSGDTDVTVSGALTFTADDWSTAQTVTVSAAHDPDAVDDTAVIGHTVSGGDYGRVTADSVDVTVDDDETASNGVTLTLSPESVSEGAAATTVTVRARLNGGTRGEATPVTVTVGSGTATSGTDFAAVSRFTITIAANTQSNTGAFSLSPTQDTVHEPNETVSVGGTTSVTGDVVSGAEVQIIDDDEASTAIALSISPEMVSEGAGATTVTVTARLNAAGAEDDLELSVTFTGGTATDTADFDPIEPRVMTIVGGEMEGTATFSLVPVDDDVDEGDETVVARATVSTRDMTVEPVSGMTLVIEDDDTRGVTVSPHELQLGTNDSAVYTVVLDSQPTATVTVAMAGTTGTPVSIDGAGLVFSPQDWSIPQQVTVRTGFATESTVVLTHTAEGGGYDAIAIHDVVVTMSGAEEELAAASQSLAATSRALLNSVVGVLDSRRRAVAGRASARGSLDDQDDTDAGVEPGRATGSVSAFEPASAGVEVSPDMPGMHLPDRVDGPFGIGAAPGSGQTGGASEALNLLWGRTFFLPLGLAGDDDDGSARAPGWTVWGAGDSQRFAGQPQDGRYEGELHAAYLGADRRLGQDGLIGLAVSRSVSAVDYGFGDRNDAGESTLSTDLSNLLSYAFAHPHDRLHIWAVGGIGRGIAERRRLDAIQSGDLEMQLAAGGFGLDMARLGPLRLSMIGDAGHSSLTVLDGQAVLEGLASSVQRARLGMEGEFDRFAVQPFWQLSARYDGGDGQTGAGIDLVTGLRFAAPRVSFEAQGRWFMLRSATDVTNEPLYEEFSATASLTVTARKDGTGLMLRLAPKWGRTGGGFAGAGGAMRLWSDQSPTAALNRIVQDDIGLSFNGRIGYAFQRHRGLLSPTLSVTRNEAREYLLLFGIGYESLQELSARPLNLELTIGHGTGRSAQREIGLRVLYRF